MKTPVKWLQSAFAYHSSSISNKIIIPYALLTVILAVFGVFVVTRLVAGSFEARLKNQLREAGRVVSDGVVNRERFRLEIQRAVANTIGVPDALVERNWHELNKLVSPIIVNSQSINSIIIVDTQGKEVLRLQRESTSLQGAVNTYTGSGVDFFDWPAVRRVLSDPKGRAKDAQLARDPVSNELLVYTVGPIRTADGTVGAVLVGTYLQKEILLLREMALADITLLDASGQVLATTFPLNQAEAQKVFSVFTPERYRQVLEREDVTLLDQVEGSNEIANQGRGYRLAYAPFILRDQVYGVFAVALPTNFITDTNNQSRNRLALVFSLGVVAVFLVGYLVSRRIIRPILRLVQTSRAITAGDLSQRTGIQSNDEIGVLAQTFDHMTAELQRLLKIQTEQASKLNAILDSIADGVIVQDLHGQVLVMNPAAKAILDKMSEDIAMAQAQQAGKRSAITDSSQWLGSLSDLEFHEPQRFEMGRQVLSALSSPVFTPDGEQLGTVVVLRDITREVESEKLKDDFITSVSHELRTPLTAIKGYNDLLKMTAADGLTDQQLQFISAIEENVSDLLNLIQEMLDLSQIDAGALGIDKEPVNLSELIMAEAENWREKMAEKTLTFTTQLPSDPVWICGDWNRLTRVVHNLLSNAHAYTLPGGKVTVSLKQIDDYAQVDVVDTGVGIAEEDMHFLFKRFFRAIHNEDLYDISGAGLGLYLCKAIVEAHEGGEIWVNSELNRGSTFSFKLPLLAPVEVDKDTGENVNQTAC